MEMDKAEVDFAALTEQILRARRFSQSDLTNSLQSMENGSFTLSSYTDCPVFPKFRWYSADIEIAGQVSQGTGESYSKPVATARAIGEALERLPLYPAVPAVWNHLSGSRKDPPRGSNGVAFGLTIENALNGAFRETIERKLIMDHWASKSPVPRFSPKTPLALISAINAALRGAKSQFLYFGRQHGVHVVGLTISGLPGSKQGFVSGYGAHWQLDVAVEKAFMEAWRFPDHRNLLAASAH